MTSGVNLGRLFLLGLLRDLSYSAFLPCRSDENWKKYCKCRNKAKSVIRRIGSNHFSKLFWGLDATGDGTHDDRSHFSGDGETDSSFSFCCVNEVEIMETIIRMKSGSGGVDGIPMRFIKTVFLVSSSFTLAWKIVRVIPIPKAKHVGRVDDLRLISILPVPISKIAEHIMKNQLLQSSQLRIHDMQYAKASTPLIY
ncbi:uncharacterized protein LOC131997777 [Stomoxys calcitrans]|uniref:uncharacterized protein LOC131997777 n=1 Tax=Stomoxys calcitrans TaxID=35570 RepID=UPI0027E2AF45|nr:uncharacterized protein LOC131997777 [Stomoxys calcitrans]